MRLWSQPAISYISQPHLVANPSRETVPPETVRIMLAEDQPLLDGLSMAGVMVDIGRARGVGIARDRESRLGGVDLAEIVRLYVHLDQ